MRWNLLGGPLTPRLTLTKLPLSNEYGHKSWLLHGLFSYVFDN